MPSITFSCSYIIGRTPLIYYGEKNPNCRLPILLQGDNPNHPLPSDSEHRLPDYPTLQLINYLTPHKPHAPIFSITIPMSLYAHFPESPSSHAHHYCSAL